jgi:predicted methyltransferase
MKTSVKGFSGFGCAAALIAIALLNTSARAAGDIYDGAVQHPGRPAEDLKRDALDHPAELLRLAAIKPGMRVADVLAANGYYTELLSYLVGPKGAVLMLNNKAYEDWGANPSKRVANGRLPNVEYRTIDLEHLDVPTASLDALLVIKVYHDFYWVDPDGTWPKMNPGTVLEELRRVLKPNGVLLVEDHSAKPGTGSSAAQALHRIDESYARRDFESHGFHLIGSSDVLRRPDDPRDKITYKGEMVGKTDRFVLLFRKLDSHTK